MTTFRLSRGGERTHAFCRYVIRDTYLFARARVSIRPHEKWQMHVYARTHRTYHVYCRVALRERSKPASQPTNRPTGFIITRWHRAIHADRSLTSVKHVGIIARTRGSFNTSISELASYYPRKSRRGPARAPAWRHYTESTNPPKRSNAVITIAAGERGGGGEGESRAW